MTNLQHVYEVRLRRDKRGVDLISDALPFGRLWYAGPNAISNAVGYAKHPSRAQNAVIRVYDEVRPRCLKNWGDHPKGIQLIAPKRCQAMRVGFVSPLHRWMSRITARSGSSLPEELDQPHCR